MKFTDLLPFLAFLAGLAITPCPVWAGESVGLLERVFTNGDRRLSAYIWYPTTSVAASVEIGGNPSFKDFTAIPDAPMTTGAHPLVLLSHGSGGNRASMAWLATALAEEGAVVLAINHPGSTTGDARPIDTVKVWNRPSDLRATLDAILKDPVLSPAIDRGKIAVIGHSLGAYAALALLGARIDQQALVDYCVAYAGRADCGYYARDKIDLAKLPRERLEGAYRDDRISAAIAITPALVRALSRRSLDKITTPLLLVSAPYDDQIPDVLHARYLAELLSGRALRKSIDGAGHFSFLPVCTDKAGAILEEEGEAFICDDGPGGDRADIHKRTARHVIKFLKDAGAL